MGKNNKKKAPTRPRRPGRPRSAPPARAESSSQPSAETTSGTTAPSATSFRPANRTAGTTAGATGTGTSYLADLGAVNAQLRSNPTPSSVQATAKTTSGATSSGPANTPVGAIAGTSHADLGAVNAQLQTNSMPSSVQVQQGNMRSRSRSAMDWKSTTTAAPGGPTAYPIPGTSAGPAPDLGIAALSGPQRAGSSSSPDVEVRSKWHPDDDLRWSILMMSRPALAFAMHSPSKSSSKPSSANQQASTYVGTTPEWAIDV
ncbi:hypothetical protein BDV06DRAFT_226018 [Aspergillus oleicola]